MKVRSVLLSSLALLLVAVVALSFLYPVVDDLWVENPYWNGMSRLYVDLKPIRMSDAARIGELVIDPSNSTILMIGPSKPYSIDDVDAYSGYLNVGGRILLADDFGSGNSLLYGLGLGVRFSGVPLEDALYRERKMMPRVLSIVKSENTIGVDELVTDVPTALINTDGLTVLAYASFSSYVISTSLTSMKEYGPYPVVAHASYGRGDLLLVSDSSLFLNSLLDRGDNGYLLRNVVRGSSVIDEAHSATSRQTEVKQWMTYVYGVLGRAEVKYSLVGVVVVGLFKVKWEDEASVEEDEVEAALRLHPEWSREELEDLRDRRRKARGL